MSRTPPVRPAVAGMGILALGLAACEQAPEPPDASEIEVEILQQDFESTYEPLPAETVLIENATVLTGTGERIDQGAVLMDEGEIVEVGDDIDPPADAQVIDGEGRWVTPGLIDTHSHLGVFASPGDWAHSDGNEATSPVTSEVWAEHGVWPQDPGFIKALEGGVTSLLVLPGSANIIGGRGVTLKNVPGRTAQDMKFPDAPATLKMACGENPKRVYGQGRNQKPSTRMGNKAVLRETFLEAQDYLEQWQEYERQKAAGNDAEPPSRNLRNESLAGVLNGEVLVQNHCYRADEMQHRLDIADEMGFEIAAFHHATEAYKIADKLRETDTCAALWSDWWGFKMEAWDGIRENMALTDAAGACTVNHSDSAEDIQRLNQETAKAMAAGNRMGLDIQPEHAIQWLTRNAAKSIGIEEFTGTLEPGKQADVVLWDGDPFSVYTRTSKVFIDGARIFDREDPTRQPELDFTLGAFLEGDES